jgi:hypothetical protein
MGSSGSGRFTDYPGNAKSKGGGGTGEGGRAEDRCAKAFSATLEDVEHCDFFKNHGQCPAVSTQLHVAHKKRVVAQTASGEIVGNLPITLTYLASCLKNGYKYVGVVRVSNNGPPIAAVAADFAAVAPP